MTTKVFEAKLAGKCAICQKEVLGKRVAYNENKQLCHADCLWPQKINSTDPRVKSVNREGRSSSVSNPKPLPEFNLEAELKINADLLHRARLLVDKEFENDPRGEYSLYQPSIAAVYTALSKKRELMEKAQIWGNKDW